jgi:uncharacterized protein
MKDAPVDRPYDLVPEGLRLRVRLTPRAGRAGPEGLVELPDGRCALRVRVSSPPVDGAANAALGDLLSRALRRPRSTVRLLAGHTSRLKTLALDGPAEELAARMEAWIGG